MNSNFFRIQYKKFQIKDCEYNIYCAIKILDKDHYQSVAHTPHKQSVLNGISVAKKTISQLKSEINVLQTS